MTVKRPDIATSLLWALNAKRLIGRRVARRMEEMGYASDEALAHDAKVTVKTVWRLRNGRSYPRDDTARKVSAALNMAYEDLRPPQTPEDDPELREQLHEVLSRLQRIELAVGVTDDPETELEQDEEAEARAPRSATNGSQSEAQDPEAESQ